MAHINTILKRSTQYRSVVVRTTIALVAFVICQPANAETVNPKIATTSQQKKQQSSPQLTIKDLSMSLFNTGWNRLTETPLYFQVQIGSSSESDFPQAAIMFDYDGSEEKNQISAFSVGKKFADRVLVWPIDLVAYASVQRFDDRGYQPDGWGVTLFAKAYHSFELPYIDFPVRLGLGQGLSYASRIPVSEARDIDPHQPQKLIYYLDYTLQMSLSHLIGRNSWSSNIEDIYVGYTVWHRSTFFGLFGETTSGTNYLGLSIETVTW